MQEEILNKLNERDSAFSGNQVAKDAELLSQFYLQLSSDVKEKEEEFSILSQKLKDLQSGGAVVSGDVDVNQLRAENLSLYREKEELDTKIKDLTNEIAQLNQKKTDLQQKIETYKQKQQHFQQALEEKSAKRTKLEQELDLLNKELAEVSAQFQARTADVEKLQYSVAEYKKKIQASKDFIKETESNSPHRPLKKYHTKIDGTSNSGYNSIVYGSTYQSFYTLGDDRFVTVWELPSLAKSSPIQIKGPCVSMKINRENNQMCFAGSDNYVRVMNLETNRFVSEAKSHTDKVTDVEWISNFQVLSTSLDRTVKILDLNKNQSKTIVGKSGLFYVCPVRTDPSVYAIGCRDGSISLLDIRTNKMEFRIENLHNKKPISCLVCSPASSSVYSISSDATICEVAINGSSSAKIRDFSSPDLVYKNEKAPKLAISPCGGFIAAGSENGNVVLFDILADVQPYVLKKHTVSVTCCAFAANMLITADKKQNICFWV